MFKQDYERLSSDIDRAVDSKHEEGSCEFTHEVSLPHVNPVLDLGTTVIYSSNLNAKSEGTASRSKVQETTNKDNWFFSLNSTPTHFDFSCDKHQESRTFDVHCKSQGSLFNIDLRLDTPAGTLSHGISFGGMEASLNAHFTPDMDDAQGGLGGQATVKVDLINSHYDYHSPVFCHNEMGIELMTGISTAWGWKLDKELELSLTTLTMAKEVSLPGPWGTQLTLEGYIKHKRTPHHPQCMQLSRTEKITHMPGFESPLKQKLSFWDNNDKMSPAQPCKQRNLLPIPHSFPDTSKNINGTSTDGIPLSRPDIPSQKDRGVLNELYQSKESLKATMLLSHPKETSFLKPEYRSPEAQAAAGMLGNPGTNQTSFFNAGTKEKNMNTYSDRPALPRK